MFIRTRTGLTCLPSVKLGQLSGCNAAPSYPRKQDSLSHRVKSSLEAAPCPTGTFTNSGARFDSGAVASVRKEQRAYMFTWIGGCIGPEWLCERS